MGNKSSTDPIHSKLPQVGTTIFAEMSSLARQEGAINLSQGFPDFEVDRALRMAAAKAMEDGYNQYAPMTGWPPLREKITDLIELRYGFRPSPETEITITSGATEALYCAFTALVRPGDEVLLLDPAYDSYDPAVRLNGGVPVHIPLHYPDFKPDWQMIEDYITSKTRFLVINFPHNPSGSILSEEDLTTLEQLIARHHILLVSDEVYEHIVFDPSKRISVLQREFLRQNAITVYSFGKTFHATGWKVGYVIAPPEISREIRKVHQFVTYSIHTPTQVALAEFLDDPQYFEDLGPFFGQKRDYFLTEMKNSSFTPIPSFGTYFQLMSYRDVSDLPDREMAKWLTREHKVASIPVSVFNDDAKDDKLLRFCFAKNEETLKEAARRLCKI